MGRDEAGGTGGVPGLAAAHEVLLRAAGAPPIVGRGIRPFAGSVPRLALDRAGTAFADEPACRHAVVRRLERHRTRGPAGASRSAPAPTLGRRSSGEGPPPHPNRVAAARAAVEADGRPVSPALQALSR